LLLSGILLFPGIVTRKRNWRKRNLVLSLSQNHPQHPFLPGESLDENSKISELAHRPSPLPPAERGSATGFPGKEKSSLIWQGFAGTIIIAEPIKCGRNRKNIRYMLDIQNEDVIKESVK
jgi:hypothetical protein